MYNQTDEIRQDRSILHIDFSIEELMGMINYFSKKFPNKCRLNTRKNDMVGQEMKQQ